MLDLIKRGSIAGLTAGITVAAGVLIYDLFTMAPLATPSVLARNLMGAPVVTNADMGALTWVANAMQGTVAILGYTVAHLSVFALVGVLGAWLFRPGRTPANVVTGALFGLAAGTGVYYAGFGLFAPAFVHAPAWQLILTMNAIAGVVVVAQLTDDPETGS